MKIEMMNSRGHTISEMRENFHGTDLHQRGDARLMWVSEGDLVLAQMEGRVEILNESKERSDG